MIILIGSLQTNERVLDLYCGTGTIGIYLSENAKDVTGLEINNEAEADEIINKLSKSFNIDKIEEKDKKKASRERLSHGQDEI